MKLKYIIPSLLALLTSFVSCSENDYNFPLGNIEVSTSYVSLPVGGGTTTVELNVNGDWTITKTDSKATWLEIPTPAGNADTKTITFSAESTDGGRSTEVILTCGDEKKHINVVQGITVAQNATCKEVIEGPDAKTYRVTGTVQKVTEWTKYGNWYIEDATGSFQIYGTTNFKDFSIEAGDEVTVEGPKKTYNGSTEIENGTIISVTKSLIKVDSVMVAGVKDAAIPSDGGDAEIYITTKTGSVEAEIPAEYQEWLSLKSIKVVGDETVVTVHAAKNEAAARSAELVFTTVKDGDTYKGKAKVSQKGNAGSLALPFTVAQAIEFAKANASGSEVEVYIKGIISKIANNGEFGAKYGNATFFISEDGTYTDGEDANAKNFEAFRVLYLGNQKWTADNKQIAVGQEVILCAKVKVHTDGTPETNGGYIYSINGVTTEENGVGTLANPFNAAGAIAAAKAGTSANVYVAGKVSKIKDQFAAKYGNATFWITADGTHPAADTDAFEVYQAYYLGNQKWLEGDKTLAVGDAVVVKGTLTVYNGQAETNKQKAYVYSINGDNGME
ncbi:MAG: hypothetical protein E7104_12505 [Prevotella sp.]|nr:hypothetical protein [Prevotella sp.]